MVLGAILYAQVKQKRFFLAPKTTAICLDRYSLMWNLKLRGVFFHFRRYAASPLPKFVYL